MGWFEKLFCKHKWHLISWGDRENGFGGIRGSYVSIGCPLCHRLKKVTFTHGSCEYTTIQYCKVLGINYEGLKGEWDA